MAARVTQQPEYEPVVLRVTNIRPQITEEEFLNQLYRNYGLVFRYSWKQLPNSGAEALVELDNPERAIALNQQILSRDPSELKLEKVTDARVLTNLIHDILVLEDPTKSTTQRGTILKVSITDVKLRVTIPALRRLFRRHGEVVMIAVVGPKPFDKTFCTIQALVQYRSTWEAFRAYNSLDGKDIFPQNGCQMIIELTDMQEIFVTDRVNQMNPVRHGGQYRKDSGSRPALQPAGPGRGRFPDRTYNDLDNPVPRYHGRPPQSHMPPPSSSPVVHLSFIPLEVTEQQMFNIFTLYGNVVKIMFLDPGRTGKRTSLIELGSSLQANTAQFNLNNFVIYRSRIHVRPAQRTSITTGIGREAYHGQPENCRRQEEWLNFPPTRRLRVTGLRPGVTIEELRVFFQVFNPIDIRLNSNNRNNTNDCEVDFDDTSIATEALATLHGTRITPNSPAIKITFRP